MSEIILYSTGCPMCKMVEEKFAQKGIKYIKISDPEIIVSKGIKVVPQAEIDGKLLRVKEILNWLKEA